MGMVQKVVWIRLKSKHSHNLGDRTFSMILEKLWGKRGTGPGCASPWDFEVIMQAAMEMLPGQTQLAWNWGNFDWVAWANSFRSVAPDFGDQLKMRFWQYDYDELLIEHGC
eukprot:3163735-Pleurochrysis_carterae.AAC.1